MNQGPPPFLESSPHHLPGAPVLIGVPYEGTACFRKGTAQAPDAVREVSDGLESYSPLLDADLLDIKFTDVGNLTLLIDHPEGVTQLVRRACQDYLSKKSPPVFLGGEHSLTPGAVAGALEHHPDLCVLQLDAHADLRDEWTESRWSHACAMRRVLDLIPSDRLLQCGIRSGTREEFEELRSSQRLVPPVGEELAARLAAFEAHPLYLTIDLDVFDPAVLPGTGTPEPGGIDWATFESLLLAIPWSQVVACDVVELAPDLDPSGCSSVLAAKVVREVLLSLARPTA